MTNQTNAVGCGCRLEAGRQKTSAFDQWLRTPGYVITLAVLTAISSLAGLELFLYTVFIGMGIYVCLLGSDLLPLISIFLFAYVSPSRENNPGRYPGSVFYPMNGGIYLGVLVLLFVVSLIWRLVKDQELGGKAFWKTKRVLLPSMLLLGATYLLSGIGMDEYFSIMAKNLIFAVLQCFAVIFLYWLFTGSVHWDRAPRGYLAWTGIAVGFVVLIQLMENYLSGRIFVDGTLDRELIATGWGMHNNVGGLMAMMMPLAFYMAAKSKVGWLFNLLGTVLFIGTILSCSRGSMLMAGLAYCVCAFLLLKNRESRKQNLIIYLIAFGVVAIAVVILLPKLLSVFRLFISQMDNVSQRDNLIHYGLEQFKTEPVFGGSFFPQGSYVPWDWSNLEAFSSFFPPRWHNTLVQILASCGTVGFVAYLVHRFQTIKLFWKRRSTEHTFLAVSLGVLLCASLLDCHFFNIGPVLFYSIALAVAEKLPEA